MKKKTPGVAFYGKVRIPTIGHKAAIDQAKDIASKTGGKLTIGLSGTAEPLDLKTKKAHAERVFGHPVDTGTDHTKTLASFLSHLHKSHDHLHLVAGSDRVEEYKSFLQRYNGKADRSGKVPFNFKSWQVHPAGGERTESNKDPRKMSRAELVSSVSASKLEKLAKENNWEHFKAYHPGMPETHVRRVFDQIRKHHSLTEEIGLTFARSEMPQIGAAKSFLKYLKDNGVDSQLTKVNPQKLRSSQMEFDDTKIEGMRDNPPDNPIIISNDAHVLDGHHRWMADKLEGRNSKAYVCNLPILDLLYHAKHYSKNLTEELTRKQLAPMLDSFVSFASEKLGIKSQPNIRYKTDDDDYNSFAAYNPSSNELSVSTMNRHPMDIFRSVAHELVHHKQNEDGKLGKDIAKEGETGSDIENEANSEAGKIMRWFAKSNPDMFGKSFVVETNTAAIGGGVRGLGNVTGEVSPDGVSQYVLDNQAYTENLKNGNRTDGLWNSKSDPNDDFNWYDAKEAKMHKANGKKTFKALRSQLNEGINDPGKLKAIFLAGGPGSGKDYVMNATLAGEGLKEINSDVAFEYLMQKNGLDLEMPDEERVERDIVRGRAKNITKEQERLALAGRLGLIINGTADDLEKIKTVKQKLEADGYETMMVFVNTSNEVSRERNVERGKMGKRKVPDGTDKQGVPDNSPNIRQEKWDLAQKNIGELQKIFGNENFTVIDNTADIRKVDPEEKAKIQTNFNRVRRMAQQFVRAENKNPAARKWIEGEAQKRGITQYQEPKRYKTLTQIRKDVPQVVHKPDNELMVQARRLGLSYYGFGRFGRKVNGVNKVLYHSKGGQLVRVQLNEDLRKWFKQKWVRFDTKGNIKGDCAREPGEGKPKCRPLASARAMGKEERAKSARRKRREDPVADRPGKGGKPVNVQTEAKTWAQQAAIAIAKKKSGKYDKEGERIDEQMLTEKNKPTNPELWARAKSLARSKFDVYPSAYANGWASKWYKSKGGGWKSVNEGQEDVVMSKTKGGSNTIKKKVKHKLAENIDAKFENFITESMAPGWGEPEATKRLMDMTPGYKGILPVGYKKKKKLAQEDNNLPRQGLPVSDGVGPEFSVYRPMTVTGFTGNMAESIQAWIDSPRTQQKFAEKYGELWEQKLVEAAIRLNEAGCGCEMKETKKSVKKIKETFPSAPYKSTYGDMSPIGNQNKDELNEDWQKVNRRDKTDGLSQAAVNAYRRENPGSKLQTAVTEKKPKGKRAKRRLSFCRRMKGMKKRLTSAKTARDPDSRINKALRRWNCEE